jgi:hypothetical protein
MRKGDAQVGKEQQLPESRWESIKAKCHPAIFELGQLLKELVEAKMNLTPNSSEQTTADIEAKMERRLAEIRREYSGPEPPAPGRFAAQTIFSKQALNSRAGPEGILEIIHWERHKIPLNQDVT